MYIGTFSGDESATLDLKKNRRAYVHVARGEIEANATRLLTGDAAKLEDADSIRLANGHDAEILVFDLP